MAIDLSEQVEACGGIGGATTIYSNKDCP